MDSSLQLFTNMKANFTDLGTYTPWLADVIYYSFLAPLIAPILGSLIAEFYQGGLDISGVALDEALAIMGLHTEEYAFYFLMNSIGKLICSAMNSAGVSCTVSFSTTETDFYALLGLDPTALF